MTYESKRPEADSPVAANGAKSGEYTLHRTKPSSSSAKVLDVGSALKSANSKVGAFRMAHAKK